MVPATAAPPAKAHFVRVLVLAFLVLFQYGIARAAVESLFVEAHGARSLPAVWVAVAAVSTVVVMVYQRLAQSRSLPWLFSAASLASAASLGVLLLAVELGIPYARAALYVWKDVHVVVLIEIIWSSANAVFRTHTARAAYGFFCVMGTLGDLAGDLLVGPLAAAVGSVRSLGVPLLILPVAAMANVLLSRGVPREDVAPPAGRDTDAPGPSGTGLLRAQPYLVLILVLILLVQVVITMVDFVYNEALLRTFPDVDRRTAVGGQLYAAIAVVALVLQLSTGAILRGLGVARTLFAVPTLLGAALFAAWLVPSFGAVLVGKVASKAFDYSVFRAAKEMLYIPLPYDVKTRGKAFIDVLAYRVAKGGASLLLLGLVAMETTNWVEPITLLGVVLWLAVTRPLVQRYRGLTGEGPVRPSAG